MLHKMFDLVRRGLFSSGLAAASNTLHRTGLLFPTQGAPDNPSSYLLGYGDALPGATAFSFATGAIFVRINATAGTATLYVNTGTSTAATWTAATNVAPISTTGNLTLNGQFISPTAAPQAIATSGTVTLPTAGNTVVLNPGGAVTGVIMPVGSFDGQEITIVNEAVAADSVTFALAGTSNVADGTSAVIPGLRGTTFVWVAANSLWYRQA